MVYIHRTVFQIVQMSARMMPKENFLAVLNLEDCDQVPVFPRDLTLGLDAMGISFDQFLSNRTPEISARCVLKLQELCGHDVTVGCIKTTEKGAFGGKITRSTNGMPQISVAPFSDIRDMDDHDPSEAITDGIRINNEASRIIAKERPDLALVCNISTPMGYAMGLRGIETFVMDMMLEPDIVERLMEFGTEVAALLLENTIIEETDCAFLAAAYDNPDIVGDGPYEQLSLPGVKLMTDIAHKKGIPMIFHPHGVFSTDERQDLLRKTIGTTGIDGFQFAETNEPEGILSQTEGRCAVLGGLDPYTILLLGPDERIVRKMDQYMDVLDGHHYIPTCSCSLHVGLPINSLKIMTGAVHTYRQRHST